MNKRLIRLTESDLRRIIKESVNRVLKEQEFTLKNGKVYTSDGKLVHSPNGHKLSPKNSEYEDTPFGRHKVKNWRTNVKESVQKILKEGGKPITKEQAGHMLLSYIDNNEFGDRFYEFAQDLCNRAIQDIESKYSIVDIDGVPYTDEDEEMWYDDYRDDFMRAVFEKIQTGQF